MDYFHQQPEAVAVVPVVAQQAAAPVAAAIVRPVFAQQWSGVVYLPDD